MKKLIYIFICILCSFNSVFSQSDFIKDLIKKSERLNLDMWDLTTFAEENIEDKKQLAKFFYYWIGTNISYDIETYQEVIGGTINNEDFWKSQDESVVFETKKGVCAGYANLFNWFMGWVDIKSEIISGHIRDERNHYIELETDDDFRHAWNSIKLNGKWILVDSTWGTSQNISISEFYFDIKPEFAIITHYPEENKWQLLESPLTLEEFNNSKFIKPIWFLVGFSDIPKLLVDEKYYYFRYTNNPNKKQIVGLQYSVDNLNFEGIPFIESIVQDGFTHFRFEKTHIPKRTFFKVKIAEFENTNNSYSMKEYEDVINFKI